MNVSQNDLTSSGKTSPQPLLTSPYGATLRDFVIRFANTNGTGSASANLLFAKGLFRLGYPVGLKNIFPSNIQGMPTWFEVRLNEKGYTGRRDQFADLTVAMNPQTMRQDIENTTKNGLVLVDSSGQSPLYKKNPTSCELILVPCSDIALEHFTNPKTRALFANMIYVGALTEFFNLPESIYHTLIQETLSKSAEANINAFNLGRQYMVQNYSQRLKLFELTRENKNHPDSILITGNEAMALGCVVAGATIGAWYPITPSTSLMQSFAEFTEILRPKCNEEHGDEKEKPLPLAMIQAEDEIASIGMVLGASWMGARAFTATSGPGLSLMNEFLGFAYYAEIPTVLFDIQRNGPSTGMPTRTQQSDLLLAAHASHGDTEHILLFPSSMEECYDFAKLSFDLAERFQTPVIVMGELETGMNTFKALPFKLPDPKSIDRGKRVLKKEEIHSSQKDRKYFRYMDYDGDGIAARSFPGTDSALSYFTRGSGHDAFGRYTEDSKAYSDNLARIKRKFYQNLDLLPTSEVFYQKESKFCLVYIGSTQEIIPELLELLQTEFQLTPSLLRLRAFPFNNQELKDLAKKYSGLIVIEQNRDAQLTQLIVTSVPQIAGITELIPLCFFDGEPLKARQVALAVHDAVAQRTETRL